MLGSIRKLASNELFLSYFRNTSWLMAESVVRMFIGITVIGWVARFLGTANFGLLTYSQSLVALFAAVATLGLDNIVTRELVKEEGNRNEILGTSFILKLVATMFILGIILVAAPFIYDDSLTALLLMVIGTSSLFQSFSVIKFYYQSKVLSKYTTYANIYAIGITSSVKIALILLKSPLIYFAWAIVLEHIALSFFLVYYYSHHVSPVTRWRFNKEMATNLLKDSWPLLLAYLAYQLYSRIDQVMVKELLNNHSAGLYAAAYKFYELPLLIAIITARSIYPLMIKQYKVTVERLHSFFYAMSSWMTLFSYLIILFLFLFGKEMISLVFGNDFIESFQILLVLSVGLIPLFNGFIRSNYITIINSQKLILYTTITSALLNIILNFIFIKVYGVLGAAIATVLTQFVSLIFLNLFSKSLRKIFQYQVQSLFLLGLNAKVIFDNR